MKRTGPLARKKPMKRVSSRRQREGKVYAERRKAFLEAHRICAVWLKVNGWVEDPDYDQSYCKANDLNGHFNVSIMEVFNPWQSTQVHHISGRHGNYLKEDTWAAVSKEGHEKIHRDPKWARSVGLLK